MRCVRRGAVDANRIGGRDEGRIGAPEFTVGPRVVDLPGVLLGGDVNLEPRPANSANTVPGTTR